MSEPRRLLLSRRDLLKAGGLAASLPGPPRRAVPGSLGTLIVRPTTALAPTGRRTSSSWARTAGSPCRPTPSIFSSSLGVTVHPDLYAPDGKSTYIFGFANATGLSRRGPVQPQEQGPAQRARCSGRKEGVDFRVQLTNVGLAQRPDLFDEHTVHWHGFKNVIPFFDGEPTGSISIPQGQTFTYVYVSHDPGTYMFHCHVEDTEHVHMGMTGIVFVRPAQDGTSLGGSRSSPTTMGRLDGLRPRVRHVPQRGLRRLALGGRAHPAARVERLPGGLQPPQRPGLPGHAARPTARSRATTTRSWSRAQRDTDWNLIRRRRAGPDLDSQPLSALVTCNAGERVLLRFANLGYMEAAMTLIGPQGPGRRPRRDVHARADRLQHAPTTRTSCPSAPARASTPSSPPPPSAAASGTSGHGYDTYVLYNRAYTRGDNLVGDGGGQRTEIRVYPAGHARRPAYPNQHPDDLA